MNKNELLKLIINSNIEDFDIDAVNYLLKKKTFSEYPMKNAETHSNCIEESSTSSAKSGLLKSSSFTNHENSFEDISVNKAVFTRSKEVPAPPYMVLETQIVNWRLPSRELGECYPDELIRDPNYKAVLLGDYKIKDYRENHGRFKKNYYIRSLKKALGVNNTKVLNSTKFVGLQFIDRAFKENTHMEYLKEMFQRLNYVLADHVSTLQTEFSLYNIKTAIILFLRAYTSSAFTAVYLFKSMFGVIGFSDNNTLLLLDKDQKIKLGDFVDSYYHDCTEEAAKLGNDYKNVYLGIRFSDLIYLAFANDDGIYRKYCKKISSYPTRLFNKDLSVTAREYLKQELKFMKFVVGLWNQQHLGSKLCF